MTDNACAKNELSLLGLVPQVLRARDFRLYTKSGRRLIDLWQNGGAAVLGHTPPLLLREIKNTASRGLYAPFPHFTEQRFLKALSQLLPGRSFRVYAAPPAGIQFFTAGAISGNAGLAGSAAPENAACLNAALWRPFLDFCLPSQKPDVAQKSAGPPLVLPVLPGVQGWRNGLPYGLCVCAVLSGFEEKVFSVLPPGDFLSPILLAAAARGIWDLIAAAPVRANVQWQRVNKIIKTSPWQRRGIYLFPRTPPAPEAWDALFRLFLDAGFLLPPVPEHPLILPGILSPGEEAKLAAVLQITVKSERT